MKRIVLSVLSLILLQTASAQQLKQVLRGQVIDKQVKNPLIGATLIISSTPTLGSFTDESGFFRIDNVAVGTYTITVTYVGYKPAVIPNIIVSSGKESVLTIEMEGSVVKGNEIVVTADKRKDLPLNEMSAVSTRTFSVEETQKYAAAVNDPARMVTSYAGVTAPDDGNNKLAIRGNSPNGLLWKMEGADIPNPNHFSDVGTSGGGVSILSAQLLSNSDFVTGAFAAEYGNALSGVFDLKLRKGNNEKKEWTAQVNVLGLNLAAEGPFAKNYNGSYLINYRFSTLGILSKMGVLGLGNATTFQDLAYNIFLPTKKMGYFSLFGFGGLSGQKFNVSKDSSLWEHFYDRFGGEFYANTGLAGFTHSYIFNSKAYLKTTFSVSDAKNGYQQIFTSDEYKPFVTVDNKYSQQKQTISSLLNYKFTSKLSLRTGVIQSRLQYSLNTANAETPGGELNVTVNESGYTFTTQSFAQFQFHANDKLTINAGAHYLLLWLNKSQAIEPRASISWDISEKQNISLGYGMHSQMQPLGSYFAQQTNSAGEIVFPNRNIDFSKANHLVFSYNFLITPDFRVRTEWYYQQLFNIPVTKDSATSFSMLNQADGFVTETLANKGTGKNYGTELTLEKFLSNRYYFMLSLSLYESRYKGSDNIEHDTRYNGNYSGTFTGGKEFVLSKKTENTVLGINAKVIYTGGFRYTPINLEESKLQETTVVFEELAYSKRNPDYFRTDIRLSLKINRPKQTSTFSVDLQNATNRKNVYGSYFEPNSSSLVTYYQTSLIPVIGYKIEF